MPALTATAYHIPAEALAQGDILLSGSRRAEVYRTYLDDGATVVAQTAQGWFYFPKGKEVRIAA